MTTSQGTIQLVWLFDVDGTLLLTDGVTRQAFARALHEHLGVYDDHQDVPVAGRTDTLILADILAKHRHVFSDGEEGRFWHSVFRAMREILPGRGRLLPGVPGLLAAIAREPSWAMGLLTGNMTEMAAIKLDRYGIRDRFAFGAFGEEAPDRNRLACVAVERARARYGVPPERCIVVGDTEHDVACARAAGARIVAVATGSRRRPELEALDPDLVLDDLSDPAPLLAWARVIGSPEANV